MKLSTTKILLNLQGGLDKGDRTASNTILNLYKINKTHLMCAFFTSLEIIGYLLVLLLIRKLIKGQ